MSEQYCTHNSISAALQLNDSIIRYITIQYNTIHLSITFTYFYILIPNICLNKSQQSPQQVSNAIHIHRLRCSHFEGHISHIHCIPDMSYRISKNLLANYLLNCDIRIYHISYIIEMRIKFK